MLKKLYSWYGKRTVSIITAAFIALAIFALIKVLDKPDPVITNRVDTPEVSVSSVQNLISGSSFTAVGTVVAVSEAKLQTEAGGRVTAVSVEIGNAVRAGTILASIENNSERASLLQAEGAYEVALAGARQGDSGARDSKTALATAENNALASVRSAYTSVNNVLISTVDKFYSNPQGAIPGVRVSGNTSFLSKERLDFEKIMPNWQAEVAGVNKENIDSALNKAEANVIKMISLLDALIVVTSTADNSETLLGLPVSSYSGALLADRATLNTTISAIQNARFGLSSAKEAVTRAEIGGTSSDVSLANAQVKIALGSLRAAQAAYEKTLIRTPITGVVNALYLKAGEYVSPGTEAAIVANNNGLEISTSISQEDREGLSVGDVVTIESKTSGVISAIAGAIDPSTGKVAIKVGVDDNSTLENGSTVSILFDKKDVTEITEVRIPLSAIKMTGNGPIVFTVNSETNVLFALAVVLGPISGDSVVVSEGVALDTLIVVDARGLKEGQIVTVKTK